MNNQSNQNNNLNNQFNGISDSQFVPDNSNSSSTTQYQQNNQNLMMNQVVNYNSKINDNSFRSGVHNSPQNSSGKQSKSNNAFSLNNNSFLKNKKVIIILGIIVLLFLLITLFGRKNISTNNGYTASSGEVIKINEITDKYNIKVISPLEKFTVTDSDLFGGNYVKLGLSISNLDSEKLNVSTINMSLTDSSKKTKYIMEMLSQDSDYFMYDSIGSGKTKTGYINFALYDDNYENNTSNIIDLDEIKYLKISVICDGSKEKDGTNKYSYSYYYLEL